MNTENILAVDVALLRDEQAFTVEVMRLAEAASQGFARALQDMAVFTERAAAAMSEFADACEPHRVVRREALAEGIHPAIHEGAL